MSRFVAAISAWNGRRKERNKRRKDEARGFDLAWGRVLVTVAACGPLLSGIFIATLLQSIVALANIAFCLLLIFYFCHVLFRSIQCSLFEWCVLIAGLGFTQWLVVHFPGAAKRPDVLAFTALFLASVVIHGVVMGLVEAELMGQKTLGRILFIFLSWWTTASPALVALGIGISFTETLGGGLLVSEDMANWKLPLFVIGGLGVAANVVVAVRISRAARELLGEPHNG